MRSLFLIVALFLATTAGAQNIGTTPGEIRKETFAYAVHDADTLRMDSYVALTPDSRTKPCLVFLFGGGFMTGTRDNRRFQPFFDYYARKGFVVVSIDYRLGMKRAKDAGLLDENHFEQVLDSTLSMAMEDLYDATAYICEHMPYVDPARIVTCGSSAGAITVLMGEYGICNAHPMAVEKLKQDFNYAGVIAFAGAVCDTQGELRWAHDPAPMMLFHGDADRNVPYDVIGLDGRWLFGSKSIADDLTRRKVPHWFYSVANTNHSMAWRPMTENRSEIDSFLEKLVFKRQPLVIDTYIKPLDAPDVPKNFGISDYIDANYGH